MARISQTAYKAQAGGLAAAAATVIAAAVARLTGWIEAPETTTLQDAVLLLITAGAGYLVGFVATWLAPRNADKLAILLLAGAALSACSLAPGGSQVEKAAVEVVRTGVADRMAYNDQKASLLLVAPCDISIGAYYRLQNTVQQEAVQMLCSGKRPWEPSPALALGTSAIAPPAGGAGAQP